MSHTLIAAAGIAEVAWMMERKIMGGGLIVIGMIALLAMLMQSRILTVIVSVLLLLYCVIFQPWYCFTPFEPKSYADPDVVLVAQNFNWSVSAGL